MKQILLLSTILIFAASCVSNPDTSSLASNEQDEKDGRICKQEEVLGSKIPQKICYTKAEIEDMERSGQNAIENERRRRMDQHTQQGLRNTGEPSPSGTRSVPKVALPAGEGVKVRCEGSITCRRRCEG